jgi:hypothetical protein
VDCPPVKSRKAPGMWKVTGTVSACPGGVKWLSRLAVFEWLFYS